MDTTNRPTLLYDGDCSFCAGLVGRLKKWDRAGHVHVVAANSEEGQRLVTAYRVTANLATTVALIDSGRVLYRSDAVLATLRLIGGVRRVMARCGGLVPRAWRDSLYDVIARNRHRLGGRSDTCLIDEKSRG